MSYKDLKRELRNLDPKARISGRDARRCALEASLIALATANAAVPRAANILKERVGTAREAFAALYYLEPERVIQLVELPADADPEERR